MEKSIVKNLIQVYGKRSDKKLVMFSNLIEDLGLTIEEIAEAATEMAVDGEIHLSCEATHKAKDGAKFKCRLHPDPILASTWSGYRMP